MAGLLQDLRYPITKLPNTPTHKYPETYADLFALFNSFRKLLADLDDALENYVQEAPEDGKLYGRKDGEWEIALEEAPTDNVTYGRQNEEWVPVVDGSGIPEAPEDGQIYGRQDAVWVVITGGGGGGISDAPNDGESYVRNSEAWIPLVFPPPGISDAPETGELFARRDGNWQEFDPGIEEAPITGITYGRKDGIWVAAGGGSGGGLGPAAITVANNGISTIPIGSVASILKVVASSPCRIRLYCTSAGLTSDISRALGVIASPTAGLIFEYLATTTILGSDLNPVPTAHNGDDPVNGYVYCNIEAIGAGTPIATFTYLTLVG